MSWVVWSCNYWLSRFRFGNDIGFESWLESFWNNRNWNVSSVSSGESINWSFFQWQNWNSSAYLFLSCFFNWNIGNAIENNRLWIVRNRNVVLSIYLDDWFYLSNYWNVRSSINDNNLSFCDAIVCLILDIDCYDFIQYDFLLVVLVNWSNWNVLFSSNNDWGSWIVQLSSKSDWCKFWFIDWNWNFSAWNVSCIVNDQWRSTLRRFELFISNSNSFISTLRLLLIGWCYWNVGFIINLNWCLAFDWLIIFTINLKNWLIFDNWTLFFWFFNCWSFFWLWCWLLWFSSIWWKYFVLEDRSVNFWNYINWNVSNIWDFESADLSFFISDNWLCLSCICSRFNWNVNSFSNLNALKFWAVNRTELLSIDLYHSICQSFVVDWNLLVAEYWSEYFWDNW